MREESRQAGSEAGRWAPRVSPQRRTHLKVGVREGDAEERAGVESEPSKPDRENTVMEV